MRGATMATDIQSEPDAKRDCAARWVLNKDGNIFTRASAAHWALVALAMERRQPVDDERDGRPAQGTLSRVIGGSSEG